jgi:hypothetical protein
MFLLKSKSDLSELFSKNAMENTYFYYSKLLALTLTVLCMLRQ